MERGRRGDVDHRAKWLYKEKKIFKKKTEGEENALVVKKMNEYSRWTFRIVVEFSDIDELDIKLFLSFSCSPKFKVRAIVMRAEKDRLVLCFGNVVPKIGRKT